MPRTHSPRPARSFALALVVLLCGLAWSLLPRVLATFPAFHLGHGSGQAIGWLRAARRLRRR